MLILKENLKIPALYLLLLFQGPGIALVGDWKSYTHLNNVTSIKAYNNKIFVGTTGGIRFYNPEKKSEQVYNNPQDGILDVEIAGFTISDENKLWAVSKKGILYRWDDSGSWDTFNRNFSAFGGTINDRAILSVGHYIILGSTSGLSFFLVKSLDDAPMGTFYETFYSFGGEKDLSITSLLRDGSTLYLGTSKGLYKATLYWDNLKNPPKSFTDEHGRFLNPQIWKKVALDSSVTLDTNSIIGQLQNVNGTIRGFNRGTVLDVKNSTRAVFGENVYLDGKEIFGSTSMISIELSGDRAFTGGEGGFYEIINQEYSSVPSPTSLPRGQIFNVASNEDATFIWNVELDGQLGGPSELFKLVGRKWGLAYEFPFPQIIGPLKHRLNVMYAKGELEVFIGNWGYGVERVSNGASTFMNAYTSCLKGVSVDPLYSVVRTLSPYKDEGLFVSMYHLEGSFSLAYIDFENIPGKEELDVTCFNPNLIFEPDATISQDIKVVLDNYLLVSTQLDLEVFKINNPMSPNGLEKIKNFEAPTSGFKDIRASNLDKFGRLWVATNGEIYTADNGLEIKRDENNNILKDSLLLVENLEAVECNFLKNDDAGNLWAGCINGLIKITPGAETPVAKLKIYTNQDGLLDNDIIHLDVDRSSGTIWAVSNKGLNSLESGGITPIASLDSVNVYPNPFLRKHEFVVFTDLTPTAKVFIMNQGGNIVFESDESQIKGGQLRWNGETRSGRKVAQGVYFYSVKAGGTMLKGKLIVSR